MIADLNQKYPAGLWVCPSCGSKVRTHIGSYVIECRSPKHGNKLVFMEMKK